MTTNPTLVALDSELAAAIVDGDNAKVTELADQFEAHGLGQLAGVLREKGASGVAEYLEYLGL